MQSAALQTTNRSLNSNLKMSNNKRLNERGDASDLTQAPYADP